MKRIKSKASRVLEALIVAIAASLLALCCMSAFGCAKPTANVSTNDLDTPAGAAPLMPASHEGRYEGLGANGCYGCHGANETANPMLTTAVAFPVNHYQDGDVTTYTLDPVRTQCITCHSLDQGSAVTDDSTASAGTSSADSSSS